MNPTYIFKKNARDMKSLYKLPLVGARGIYNLHGSEDLKNFRIIMNIG